MDRAVHPESVEYVLCIDRRWGFTALDARNAAETAGVVVVENTGRRCYVDGVNIAARAASGQILIVNADDQFPALRWDVELLNRLAGRRGESDSFVVEVTTGTPSEHERGLLVMPILSRARYREFGYVFYPAYESMFADNDFCESSRCDGVVLDAREMIFPHLHPINGGAADDAAYQAQNRAEAYRLGAALLDCRRAGGFSQVSAVDLVVSLDKAMGPPVSGDALAAGRPPKVALCLAGEMFRGEWFDAMLTLYTHLMAVRGFNVVRLRSYTTNVYVTRLEVWEALEGLPAADRPDWLLWIDDDNILTPEHFDKLLTGLEGRPDLDVLAAWSWVHDSLQLRFQVSAGNWAPDGAHWNPFDAETFPDSVGLRPAEVTGFPSVLMRGSIIDKVGKRPFLRGILDDRLPHGIGGEDLAFCRACQGVASIAVDPEVRVPHLKWMQVVPEFSRPAPDPVRLAVLLRVQNEGRWISRVIESVKMLGPVYVMDDHSTDGTAELARAAGAVVFESPFAVGDTDEPRDKTWLLERVRAAFAPDWVFFIDGDEELERGGAEKILRACQSKRHDTFVVRFVYLWDSPETARFDRWYSAVSRPSLFRDREGVSFRSFYEGAGVHAGLHCGNAPTGEGWIARTGHLNVFLLHYGYMLREDRLRKFDWYTRKDPGNAIEDGYRHIVQGDIPEVPADAVLLHAGPLDVRKLPASIVPVGFALEGVTA